MIQKVTIELKLTTEEFPRLNDDQKESVKEQLEEHINELGLEIENDDGDLFILDAEIVSVKLA